MKIVKTIERYDASGNLIERVTETTETYESAPQPQVVPYEPNWSYTVPFKRFEVTCGDMGAAATSAILTCAAYSGGTGNC